MNTSSIFARSAISRGLAAAFCAAAFLVSVAPALAEQPVQQLHGHVRSAVANGEAKLVRRVPPGQRLNLSIVLPLRNEAELHSLLGRLYNPSSPDYRKFLSVAEFTERFAPTAEDFKAVVDFAKANGFTVTDEPENRMIVPVSATAEQVEKALNIKMNLYQHPTESRVFYSPDGEPSLALSVPVAQIAGLDDFTLPKPASKKATAAEVLAAGSYQGSGPGGSYTSSDMRSAYYGGSALTGAGQVVGLFERGGYDLSDVEESFSSAGQTNNVPVNNVLLDGMGPGPVGDYDGEEVLDIVAAMGMAPGLSQVRVYIGSSDVDIFNKIATEDIAQQISVSWVLAYNPTGEDPIFEEMAAQGQSIFAASGDWGSYPSGFSAFPAEDPWVTSVGGTVLPAYTLPWPEIAWGTGYCTGYCASSGGISPDGISMAAWSSTYGLPDYQADVADASNGGSASLRNVPDVAANAGSGIYICPLAECGGWIGTSLASPLWAGYTALINQQAEAAGKPTAGFINPAIYVIGKGSNYGSDFHDMTSGSNGGFNAVTGYDLVTGWGSPNGQNLINALSGVTVTPSSTCHVVYTINSEWAGAFNATITIYNTSTTTLNYWTLTWNFANGQTITQAWGGAATESGAAVTVLNDGIYGPIPAGGSYSGLGFNGTWNNSANAAPASFALNGTVCD
jgi:subtilase family serine protease